MKSRKNILKRQSGIALITVILIVSVLAAAALELNRSTRNDIYDAANLSDGIRLTYIQVRLLRSDGPAGQFPQ